MTDFVNSLFSVKYNASANSEYDLEFTEPIKTIDMAV